jgi:hypothetical protein
MSTGTPAATKQGDSPRLVEQLGEMQMDLPVKLVVFHNSKLGFVDLEQKSAGYRPKLGSILRIPTSRRWLRSWVFLASTSKIRPIWNTRFLARFRITVQPCLT